MSQHTISSYRFTFILFLSFMEQQRKISASRLELVDITKEVVVDFLNWLQVERKCSAATRNVRLAAMHAFFHFLQYQQPDRMAEWQRILSIKAKKTKSPSVSYLSVDGIKLLLEQPDISTRKGRRDLAMLALMYDCAEKLTRAGVNCILKKYLTIGNDRKRKLKTGCDQSKTQCIFCYNYPVNFWWSLCREMKWSV